MNSSNKSVLILLFFLFIQNLAGLDTPPKREFRGVWVATVVNLDWPDSPTQSTQNQKQALLRLFDELKQSGFNAIIFQIRDESDALYNSSYDPWSYYLTGQQGRAPNPYYDPLEFAVEEAHKRNMELHAWLNPYRAEVSIGSHPMASNHVTEVHPDWVYISENRKLLDPGLPQVRDYITNVIRDIVEHYEVDAIHFDDYFYPYDPITDQDAQTFEDYSRGFTDIAEWRRDNVNILIEEIYHAIQQINPNVKFGISPFGIWKSGVPPGVTGFSSYSGIYCDPLAWIEAKTIDYLAPQCYWEIGGPQDYSKLVPWWASQVQDRNLYPGHAGYKAGGWAADELPEQIRINRYLDHCQGSIFFRTKIGVLDNPRGFRDSLITNFYRYPALQPVMPWKDALPPNNPLELAYERILPADVMALTWYAPDAAMDGDSAWRYVIYRAPMDHIDTANFRLPENIVHIQDSTYWITSDLTDFGLYAYAVTALDRLSNESGISNVLYIFPEQAPLLIAPANFTKNLRDSIEMQWRRQLQAAYYQLQITMDSTFNEPPLLNDMSNDTSYTVIGLEGREQFFWRVRAINAGGSSPFSEIFRFSTGYPKKPQPIYPFNQEKGIALTTSLTWRSAAGADGYHLQISRDESFVEEEIITSVHLSDTTLAVSLSQDQTYYWRVNAQNQYGHSPWSSIYRFTTTGENEEPLVKNFILYQNYPNPFNETTTIKFALKRSYRVKIGIYNALGQEVLLLVDEIFGQGNQSVTWNGRDHSGNKVSSGVYIYVMEVNFKISSRKMVLIR